MSGQGSDDDDLASTRPSLSLPRIPGVVLQHEIARGGMGVVYRGRQDYIDRDVAVKLLSAELTDRAFVARFRREAKILAGIDHPNIVRCHFAGQTDDGNSYLVMEFIAGASLKRHIAEHGAMPVATALRVLLALVQALDHAHQLGVIHRDVKPENILLAETKATPVDVGFPYVPKIVDLGLARASEGTGSFGVTSPGSVMGTPATMSPEQFDEPDAVDFRSDVYGLGCVLHEMLAGRPAFEAKKLTVLFAQKRSPTPPDPCAANTAIPAAVGALAQWMLATDRAARPASYAALAARIRELLDDPEVAAGGDREATRISRRPLP
ncbi:MAG: serine/threonine-protein kinase, partial [Planctomycetota bacterium]